MKTLPTLDTHAHLDHAWPPTDLSGSGAVLAMTLSLEEAEAAIRRSTGLVAWGAGCHPRKIKAQEAFDAQKFSELAAQSAFAGEIGLDSGSSVPWELQQKNFREALQVVRSKPRLVSIHSYQATGEVLKELKNNPVDVPVLHWWTGLTEETRQAVELGCYFSIHSQVARQSKFHRIVPLERVLLESDHGYHDPPAAIPCRIEWVEYLVAQQYGLSVAELRIQAWKNLAAILRKTDTLNLLPRPFASILAEVN